MIDRLDAEFVEGLQHDDVGQSAGRAAAQGQRDARS